MAQLNMNKIAKGLGAKRQGKVSSSGGYFGALQLLADIESRIRFPVGSGHLTDPGLTERRYVRLTQRTMERLEEIAAKVEEQSGVSVKPMQLAALLLEKAIEDLSAAELERLIRLKRGASR
jgi:hypothetical protein